jgi:hypothetical protein
MNAHLLAASVGRWVAPLVLGAATLVGTLSFSPSAQADESAVVQERQDVGRGHHRQDERSQGHQRADDRGQGHRRDHRGEHGHDRRDGRRGERR